MYALSEKRRGKKTPRKITMAVGNGISCRYIRDPFQLNMFIKINKVCNGGSVYWQLANILINTPGSSHTIFSLFSRRIC